MAGVVLVALVGGGIAFAASRGGSSSTPSASNGGGGSVAQATNGAPEASAAADQTPPAEGPTPSQPPEAAAASTPAEVAQQINTLIRQEAQAHRNDNVAVGFVADCTASASDVQNVASFRALRDQLNTQLQALPDTGDQQLDHLRSQLVDIWSELVGVDGDYVTWAQETPGVCPRTDKPTTSQASKDRRANWRDAWMNLIKQHSEWGISPVELLVEGGADGAGTYLLL